MRYLKLYEDFNTDKLKIKDLLEDIAALDYILSDEGINAKYFVTEKMASDAPNRYMIGTSDDISSKIDDSFEDVGVYKIQIYFDTKPNQEEALEEYFNKLKEHIEDVYDVNVLKEGTRPSYEWNLVDGSVKSTVYGNENCISIIVERQPDDYIYFDDEDEDINESSIFVDMSSLGPYATMDSEVKVVNDNANFFDTKFNEEPQKGKDKGIISGFGKLGGKK